MTEDRQLQQEAKAVISASCLCVRVCWNSAAADGTSHQQAAAKTCQDMNFLVGHAQSHVAIMKGVVMDRMVLVLQYKCVHVFCLYAAEILCLMHVIKVLGLRREALCMSVLSSVLRNGIVPVACSVRVDCQVAACQEGFETKAQRAYWHSTSKSLLPLFFSLPLCLCLSIHAYKLTSACREDVESKAQRLKEEFDTLG